MGWIDRLLGRAPVIETPVVAAVREAAPVRGVMVDADEAGWRRLSHSKRDLEPLTHARSLELAYYAWERNRLANRLIELPLAYLLAGGVRIEVDDPQTQEWIDQFWEDPISRWDLRLVDRVRELHLFGEQVFRLFINPVSGHIRVAGIDPHKVVEVITDPDNSEMVIAIKVRETAPVADEKVFRAVINCAETELGPRAQALRASLTAGDVVFWRINGLSAGARGRSDLLSAVDWADVYEELLFGELDRATTARTVMWDCTVTGADEDELRKRAATVPPPKGNSVRFHNENETWASVSPELAAADFSATTRTLLTNILGGSTIPGHWYGDGGDVNRATASEMADPSLKVMSLRQETLKALLGDLAVTVIRSRLAAVGRLPADGVLPPLLRPKVIMPELTSRDVSRYSAALQQLVAASSIAVDRDLLTRESAVALIALVAEQLGLEIDVSAELAAVDKAAAAAASADLFPGVQEAPQAAAPADTPAAPAPAL